MPETVRPLAEEPTAVERITEAAVREQNLRSTARRNGRASHLVGASEPSAGEPPVPTEPIDDHHDHGPNERGKHLLLGLVYLGAGSVAILIGALMLKDAFQGGNK